MKNCKIAGLVARLNNKEHTNRQENVKDSSLEIFLKPEKKRIRIQVEHDGSVLGIGRYDISVLKTAKKNGAVIFISPDEKGAYSLGFTNQKKQNLSLYVSYQSWSTLGLDKIEDVGAIKGWIFEFEGKVCLCIKV